jgi:hypothetical protein
MDAVRHKRLEHSDFDSAKASASREYKSRLMWNILGHHSYVSRTRIESSA